MFVNSLTNKSELSEKTKNSLINKTQKSKEVKKEIKKAIEKNQGKDFSNYDTKELYFKSGDLGLAIGKVNAKISGTKNQDNSWNITITISDRYDFDGKRKGLTISNILNNIGDTMENIGILHPYD